MSLIFRGCLFNTVFISFGDLVWWEGLSFLVGGDSHCNIWGKKGWGWSKHELSVHWTKSSFAPSTHTHLLYRRCSSGYSHPSPDSQLVHYSQSSSPSCDYLTSHVTSFPWLSQGHLKLTSPKVPTPPGPPPSPVLSHFPHHSI